MDPIMNINYINLTYFVQLALIFWFFLMLIIAILLLVNFYICDSSQCKGFDDAAKAGEPGSKNHILALLDSLFADGLWPIPYIASAILTPIALYFADIPITVKNFAIIFLISFIVNYFMLLFISHHYVKFIKSNVNNYIVDNCQNNINNDIPDTIINDDT